MRASAPKWHPGLLLAYLAGALLALAGSACRSLPRDVLAERLLELEKNAPVASTGLLRRPLAVPSLSADPLELVYLHVPAAAPSAAAPVVLVHGTPSTLFTWSPLVFGGPDFAGLAGGRDVYALEVPGHGVSPADLSGYTFQGAAEFVAAALRALELGPVHLVGQSYGGEFAWRAALDAPERVRTLTVMDSSGYERRPQDWLPEEVEMREHPLASYGWLLNARSRIETALAPHYRTIPPERVEEFFLVCENAENWRAMIDLVRDENGTRQADIASLKMPTLVLWGADDVAYPPDVYAQRFADEVPRSELLLLPATGHYPHEERPAEVARALADFFRRHDP